MDGGGIEVICVSCGVAPVATRYDAAVGTGAGRWVVEAIGGAVVIILDIFPGCLIDWGTHDLIGSDKAVESIRLCCEI